MTPQISYRYFQSNDYCDYFVSSDGRIFKIREVKPGGGTRKFRRYYVVCLFDNKGVKKYRTVHSIVAEAFIGPRPEGLVINHKNGNHLDNSANNLEYVTQSENISHAWKIGLKKRQPPEYYRQISKLGIEKLRQTRRISVEDVASMIQEYRDGYTMKEIGQSRGVSASMACMIINGKFYKDVTR